MAFEHPTCGVQPEPPKPFRGDPGQWYNRTTQYKAWKRLSDAYEDSYRRWLRCVKQAERQGQQTARTDITGQSTATVFGSVANTALGVAGGALSAYFSGGTSFLADKAGNSILDEATANRMLSEGTPLFDTRTGAQVALPTSMSSAVVGFGIVALVVGAFVAIFRR